MPNDNGLVDELENIEKQKIELNKKSEELREKIIELAKQKNTKVLFGNHKKCFIRKHEKIIYPVDKTNLINLIKQKGLWNEFSMINYSRFNSSIIKGNFDKDIMSLIKKESTFMVVLKDKEWGM